MGRIVGGRRRVSNGARRGTDLLVTAPAPPTSVAGCVTSSDRDVPHPELTPDDRAAITAAVTRYTAAIGACLAGIAAGTALAAVVPVAGAVLLLVSFLTGVVVFARRLDLTHPRPGSRFHGRPIILRVNPVAAAAHGRWLDHDGGDPDTAEEIGVLLAQLAELTSAGRGDSAAANALTERLVTLVDVSTGDSRRVEGRGDAARG